MEKFIPYDKLSKKEKRKIDQARRQTWGELNPVTRKPENSKAYNRNKARNWKRDYHEPIPVFIYINDVFYAIFVPNKLETLPRKPLKPYVSSGYGTAGFSELHMHQGSK